MENNQDLDISQSQLSKDDAEGMVYEDESSDSDDSDDSEKEREEHYALERRIVELRKEVLFNKAILHL